MSFLQIQVHDSDSHSFTTGMACIIKCGIDILNILRTELSNCHTIIFETLSVGKKYEKVKNTPCRMQKVNILCIYVHIVKVFILVLSQKIVVKNQLQKY